MFSTTKRAQALRASSEATQIEVIQRVFIVVLIAKTASTRSSQASLSGGPQGRVHLSDLQAFSSQQLPQGGYGHGRHDFRF